MGTGIFTRGNRRPGAALRSQCTSTAAFTKSRRSSRAPWLSALPALLLTLSPLAATASQFVELDYNLTLAGRARNSVFLELFDDKPLTQANFLQYVNNTSVAHGNYTGSFMHRLAKGFVIQGGGFYPSFI